MGEQADLIINGDVCQVCGCNFEDEGGGYPRTCGGCGGEGEGRFGNRIYRDEEVDTAPIEKLLQQNNLAVIKKRHIDYGTQLRISDGGIINVYYNGKINLQGKPSEKLKKLF